MDFTPFRRSQELSDIEIIVQPDDHRYSLHKFPLYTKSEHIRHLVTDDPNLKSITLDNFPGGAKNFERVADFCYSHYAEITKDNVVDLACAARNLAMQGSGNLIELTERHIGDLLTSAKLTRSVGIIVELLVQCNSDDDVKNSVRDKCIDTIIEIWSKPPSRFPYKRDQGPNIQDLSLDIVKRIIHQGKEADVRGEFLYNVIREYTERYLVKETADDKKESKPDLKLNLPLDIVSDDEDNEIKTINGHKTMDENASSSDSEDEVERGPKEETQPSEEAKDETKNDQDEKADEAKNDDDKEGQKEAKHDTPTEEVKDQNNHAEETEPETVSDHPHDAEETEEEKEERESKFAETLDALVMELPEKARPLRDESTIHWIIQALEVANRKSCECRERLLYAASTVLAQIPEKELRTMTPDLVCDLLNEAGRSGFHFANTVSVITDFYILDKAKEGTLDKDTFIKLAQALPDGFRTNLDTLYEAYGIMSKDCSQEERDSILKALDLSRLSEDAMAKAHETETIPAELIIPALINRCRRLKGDLEKAKEVIKTKEAEQYRLAKTRPYSTFVSTDLTPRSYNSTNLHAWPMSARDSSHHRYETSSYHTISSANPLSSSPRHKTTTSGAPLAKPIARKPVTQPSSARYHQETPKTPKQSHLMPTSSRSASKLAGPGSGSRGSNSLPTTPRSAWTTPQKAPRRMPPDALLPDYSSSGIGPDDARQVLYELSLTSPRLSYMYNSQNDVPERDYTVQFSPRRAKKT